MARADRESPQTSLRRALRTAGLRVTRQRLAVMAALARHGDAITAQELHHELRREDAVGLATVYRTLSALAGSGEVDVFQRDGGEQAFRLCGSDHHHHLVCERCGSVQEIAGAEVEQWVIRVAKRHGFRVTGHSADVYGLCRACR